MVYTQHSKHHLHYTVRLTCLQCLHMYLGPSSSRYCIVQKSALRPVDLLSAGKGQRPGRVQQASLSADGLDCRTDRKGRPIAGQNSLDR